MDSRRDLTYVTDATTAFDIILHGKQTFITWAHMKSALCCPWHKMSVNLSVEIQRAITHVRDRAFNDRRYFIDCSKFYFSVGIKNDMGAGLETCNGIEHKI